MFRVGRVSTERLEHLASQASSSKPTYEAVGATLRGERPSGYRNERHSIRLPSRPDSFALASDGLRAWIAHRGAGLAVAPLTPPAQDATVAVAAPLGPLTAVALCRVVAVIDEPTRYGFAYGTLPGHPEEGEEAFVIEHADNDVTFTVTVFSKPAELLPRMGGPITRHVQKSATNRYLPALEQHVQQAPTQ